VVFFYKTNKERGFVMSAKEIFGAYTW